MNYDMNLDEGAAGAGSKRARTNESDVAQAAVDTDGLASEDDDLDDGLSVLNAVAMELFNVASDIVKQIELDCAGLDPQAKLALAEKLLEVSESEGANVLTVPDEMIQADIDAGTMLGGLWYGQQQFLSVCNKGFNITDPAAPNYVSPAEFQASVRDPRTQVGILAAKGLVHTNRNNTKTRMKKQGYERVVFIDNRQVHFILQALRGAGGAFRNPAEPAFVGAAGQRLTVSRFSYLIRKVAMFLGFSGKLSSHSIRKLAAVVTMEATKNVVQAGE